MDRKEPKRRALIVDDHHDTRQLMSRLLGLAGFETEQAATLAEAHAKLGCCQIVLLDLHLPDGSGLELLHRIRLAGDSTKVAVTSGAIDLEILAALHAARPDVVFTKPFHFSELVQWLNEN